MERFMKRKFVPMIAAAVSTISFAAFAQTTTGAAQAESDYRAEQARCNEQTGTARISCLSDARAAHSRALSANQPNTNGSTRAGAGMNSGTGGGEPGPSNAGGQAG